MWYHIYTLLFLQCQLTTPFLPLFDKNPLRDKVWTTRIKVRALPQVQPRLKRTRRRQVPFFQVVNDKYNCPDKPAAF